MRSIHHASPPRRRWLLLLPLLLAGCGRIADPPPAGTLPASAATQPADDLVTVPSWVGLVGPADTERRGAYGESSIGEGDIALSFGQTTGFAAPIAATGPTAIEVEDRRTANIRTAPREIAGSSVVLSAGVRETRESGVGNAAALAAERSAAGAGGTVRLLDGRISLDGEVAGARSSGPDAGEDSFAQRLRASVALVQFGDSALSASAFAQSAGIGYSMPGGVAPDWSQQGVGLKLASGPISISLDAEDRHNNLAQDAEIATARERMLRPSLALSLDRLRTGAGDAGLFVPGWLLPSTVRISHAATWHEETADAGGAIDLPEDANRRTGSNSLSLDWDWRGARSTLTLGAERIAVLGDEAANDGGDGTARSVTLSHATRGRFIVTTLALAARHSEGTGAVDGGRSEGYDLSAAVTGRDGPLGDLVAAVAIHQDRAQTSPESDMLMVDTSWHARIAFDLSRAADDELREGALKFALGLKGGEPESAGRPFGAELMFGLTSQFGF